MRGFLFLLFTVFVGAGSAQAGSTIENCEKARNSADVMRCLSRHYEDANTQMQSEFEALNALSAAEELEQIKAAQAHWVAYRDLECGAEVSNLEQESLKRIEGLRCLNRLTLGRVEALQVTRLNEQTQVSVGETAAALPRWMNALAIDHPDVFWRYGKRIDGDLDCDSEKEHVVAGLKFDKKTQHILPVIAISENPTTGRPANAVIELLPEKPEVADAHANCSALTGIAIQTQTQGDVCKATLILSAPGCAERRITWSENAYVFAE